MAIAAIASALAWPAAVVALGVYFRREVADLAQRLREGGGAKFAPPSQQISATSVTTTTVALVESKGSAESLTAFPNTPAALEWEHALRELDALKAIKDPSDRERYLLRFAAHAVLTLQFEQADASIWESQLEVLNYLNSIRPGVPTKDLKTHFYDRAAKQYPVLYAYNSFENYLAFLQRFGLIRVEGARTLITQEGIEYLAWRVAQAKPPKSGG